MALSALILLFITFTIISYYIINFIINYRKLPPGPISIPFFGTSHIIKKYSIKYRGLHIALAELCKLYKTDMLRLKLAGSETIVIQGEKLIEEALLNDDLLGRPTNYFVFLRSLGTNKGITMTDGPLWQEQRQFAMKQLHNLGFGKRTMEGLILDEVQNFINKYKNGVTNVNLKVPISICVLNVLWAMVAGYKIDQEKDIEELLRLMNKRSEAFDIAGGMLNQFPWIRYIAPESSGYNLIKYLNNRLNNIMSTTISEHKATYDKNVTRDYIDAFLHEMYSDESENSTFTDDQLIMACLDFFIAGSITTTCVLDYLLFHMILSPHVQQKAYDEISQVLRPGEMSAVQLKQQMPYVQAIMLENDRMTPIIPVFGPRRTVKDTKIGDYIIPKDFTIFFNHYPFTQDSEKWENSDVFSPERFIKMGLKEGMNTLFTFGKGRRRCPGQKLGENFIFLFITSFLNNFKLVSANEKPPTLSYVPGMMLHPVPYNLTLIPREKC